MTHGLRDVSLDALKAMVVDAEDELARRGRSEVLWPPLVFEAAVRSFGGAIYSGAKSKSFRALDRRVRHALRVWKDKYGPLNPAQEEYAARVLAGAIDSKRGENTHAFVLTRLDRAVNHETVHAGFASRADARDRSLGVGEMFAGVPE